MHNVLYSNVLKLKKAFFYDLTFHLACIQFLPDINSSTINLYVYVAFSSYQIIFQAKFSKERFLG